MASVLMACTSTEAQLINEEIDPKRSKKTAFERKLGARAVLLNVGTLDLAPCDLKIPICFIGNIKQDFEDNNNRTMSSLQHLNREVCA